ncbi:DUF5590 domain-containing protein [Cytobacillus sp. FJAT-54145]|uniref:DUF5590 domain-containing protein n=1 Tax=Cytobacillus spartinae TaxID=3299023 RepID=A0ABW6KER1_9BACI
MKKWIFIVSIVIVILIGIMVNVYLNAVEPIKTAKEKAENIAIQETSLVTMTDFSLYNGSYTYYVVKGLNEDKEEIIVWINEEERTFTERKVSDGISREEAIQRLYEEKSPEKVMRVQLGMENGVPLWEIYYRTEKNLINYYYVDFKTGEWLRDIQNL